MAKVTGKFQITLPKALVEHHGIRVGDELDVTSSGHTLHLVRRGRSTARTERTDRLLHFDRATKRQQARGSGQRGGSRGWTREELYDRGRAR